MSSPLVSVIMPMYNVERYVGMAVESVLAQTYGNFELLIVDDCSPDRSIEVVRSFADKRIRIIRHERNLGLAHARNSGISESKGGLLAFLDSDDLMMRDRLAKQLRFLNRHPNIALCGGGYRIMGPEGLVDPREYRITIDPDAVNASLAFTNLFNFSTVTMRKEAVPDEGFRNVFAEDLEFLIRLASTRRLGILREALACYRMNPDGIMQTTAIEKMMLDTWAARSIWMNSLGVGEFKHFKDAYIPIIAKKGNLDVEEVKRLHEYFMILVGANARVKLFEPDAFKRAASYVWFSYLCRASGCGLEAIKLLYSSTLAFRHSQPAMRIYKFLAKAFMRRPFLRQQ